MAAGLLALHGCATLPAGVPPPPAAPDRIAVRPGRPGFVVAAPRGGSDADTDEIAAEIARRTGFGLVVARGASSSEVYEARVREAAQGPLRFYAEIHGSARTACAGRLQIATVGVDRELALRLRTLAELIRDAHLRANTEVQRLDVAVESTAPVTILRLPERAMQIALPGCSRRDFRETYTAILADFLSQAVTLPVGR